MSYKGSCDQNMMWGRGMCVFNGALAVVELEPNFIESPDKNFFFFMTPIYISILYLWAYPKILSKTKSCYSMMTLIFGSYCN